MSVVVTISNEAKLNKARNLLGAKTESETVELALEKVIEDFELNGDSKEEDGDLDIDVHTLNRIPPKQTYRAMAKVRFGGRGKPLKYDLSDYNFEEEDK